MNITNRLLKAGLNHRTGRRATAEGIAIHVTEGSAASVVSWFNSAEAQVSSNYMIRTTGVIDQFVSEDDEAWAQGRVNKPTAQIVIDRPGENPNSYLLSIEHEGDGTHELTDPQRAASVALIRDICGRHNIPIDRYHIVGHHEVYSLKPCPGAIDVDRLVGEAAGHSAPVAPGVAVPEPPIVWSGFLMDWLVVTRVVSDREWYFVPLKQVQAGVPATQASALLSTMPTRRS